MKREETSWGSSEAVVSLVFGLGIPGCLEPGGGVGETGTGMARKEVIEMRRDLDGPGDLGKGN